MQVVATGFHGVDAGRGDLLPAAGDIFEQIFKDVRDLADRGAAILYYTSELEEVPLACDRAIVMFNGRVVDIVEATEADEARLMRAAYGLTATEGAA